jgi:hypothetical protein
LAAPILRPIARAREPGRGRSRLELAIVNHSLRTSRSIGYFPCIRVLRDVSQLGAIGREASRGSAAAMGGGDAASYLHVGLCGCRFINACKERAGPWLCGSTPRGEAQVKASYRLRPE